MSDYLTSLAARAVDAAAAVRPRQASLYEPPPVAEATPEFETAEVSSEAPPPHLVKPAAEPSPRHEPQPRMTVVHETTEKRVEVTHETEKRVVAEPPAPQPPRIVETRVLESVATPVRPPPPEPLPPKADPPPRAIAEAPPTILPRERTTERVVVERIHKNVEQTLLSAPAPPSPLTPEQTRVSALRPQTVEPQVIERPVVVPQTIIQQQPPERTAREILAEPRPLPPARVAVAPQITPQPKPALSERPAREEPPPDSEPSIHVTIGRIEVRAVPAEQPVRRPAPPAERMSLDDYLRRRGERPRR